MNIDKLERANILAKSLIPKVDELLNMSSKSKHHGEVYTNYGVPFSVDEDRVGDHTELFWKGIHTKEEIVNLIKNNQFLARQFKMDEAIKDVATVCGVRYEDIKSAINMTQVFAGGKKKRI